MENLLNEINELKSSDLKIIIDKRLQEFKELGSRNSNEIFKELCFCILTANCAAEKCIEVQSELNDDLLILKQEDLAKRLKELGYRFPNLRSKYIVGARFLKDDLKERIESFENSNELRAFLAKNVKGLGFKESSHFLRNIGFDDLAIIDFHIIDVLNSHALIEKPKTLTKKRYIEIENVLKDLGNKVQLNMAELDLYLWHMETGKVLK